MCQGLGARGSAEIWGNCEVFFVTKAEVLGGAWGEGKLGDTTHNFRDELSVLKQKFLLIGFREIERERERGREMWYHFIVPLIYTFVGRFLHVP